MLYVKRLIFIQFSLELISGAFLVLSSWTVFSSTGSSGITGLFVSVGFIPSLLSNIYIGAIVDRWDCKKMLQLSLLIMLIAILFIIIGFKIHSISLLFVTQMLMQLGGSMFRPSIQVYMTYLYESEKLTYLFTKSASMTILGGILGAFIASQVAVFSIKYVSIFMLVCMLINIAISLKLPNLNKEKPNLRTRIHHDIKEGFAYIRTKSIFLKLFVVLGSGQLITHCVTGFLAAFTYETFTDNPTIYGYLQIILTIGGAVLGFCSKHYLSKIENVLSRSAFIFLGISLWNCFYSSSFIFIRGSLFFIGLITTWIRSHYQAIQQINTAAGFNGEMASFRMIVNQGSVVVISPLLGFAGASLGSNYIFGALSIVAFATYFTSIKIDLSPLVQHDK